MPAPRDRQRGAERRRHRDRPAPAARGAAERVEQPVAHRRVLTAVLGDDERMAHEVVDAVDDIEFGCRRVDGDGGEGGEVEAAGECAAGAKQRRLRRQAARSSGDRGVERALAVRRSAGRSSERSLGRPSAVPRSSSKRRSRRSIIWLADRTWLRRSQLDGERQTISRWHSSTTACPISAAGLMSAAGPVPAPRRSSRAPGEQLGSIGRRQRSDLVDGLGVDAECDPTGGEQACLRRRQRSPQPRGDRLRACSQLSNTRHGWLTAANPTMRSNAVGARRCHVAGANVAITVSRSCCGEVDEPHGAPGGAGRPAARTGSSARRAVPTPPRPTRAGLPRTRRRPRRRGVLPTPPGPTSVTSGWMAASRRRSAKSWSRPTVARGGAGSPDSPDGPSMPGSPAGAGRRTRGRLDAVVRDRGEPGAHRGVRDGATEPQRPTVCGSTPSSRASAAWRRP